jgi:hypothetical protein
MKCPVCGARCVCRNANEMCCSCHHHKAGTPFKRLGREIAHAVSVQSKQDQIEPRLFPELIVNQGDGDSNG